MTALGVAIFLFLSFFLVLEQFGQLEEKENRKSIEQLQALLEMEQNRIDDLVKDWALWDDTYNYMEDRNPGFLESNFGEGYGETGHDIGMSLIGLFDRNRNPVYLEHTHPSLEGEAPVDKALFKAIRKLLDDPADRVSGLVRLPRGLMFLVGHRIYDSKNQAPYRGWLVMGRYLDPEKMGRLSKGAKAELELELDAPALPAPSSRCRDQVCINQVPLTDLFGRQAGVIRFEKSRELYGESVETVVLFIGAVAALALAGVALFHFLIRRMIIARVERLSRHVARLDAGFKELPPPVELGGDDELTRLGEAVNRLTLEAHRFRMMEADSFRQARLASLGEMTRTLAHHWRQPLQVVSFSVANIQEDYETDELNDEWMEHYSEEIDRHLGELSKTIDLFQGLYRSGGEENRTRFPLGEVAAEVAELMKPVLESRGVLLERDVEAGLAVEGEREDVVQLFFNLLNNACDALEQRNTGRRIVIRGFREGKKAVIRVEDNGIGIPPENLERIFDPYFSTKKQAYGSGLGLYLSRLVAANGLGGSLDAENLEEGARFTLRVPLAS